MLTLAWVAGSSPGVWVSQFLCVAMCTRIQRTCADALPSRTGRLALTSPNEKSKNLQQARNPKVKLGYAKAMKGKEILEPLAFHTCDILTLTSVDTGGYSAQCKVLIPAQALRKRV